MHCPRQWDTAPTMYKELFILAGLELKPPDLSSVTHWSYWLKQDVDRQLHMDATCCITWCVTNILLPGLCSLRCQHTPVAPFHYCHVPLRMWISSFHYLLKDWCFIHLSCFIWNIQACWAVRQSSTIYYKFYKVTVIYMYLSMSLLDLFFIRRDLHLAVWERWHSTSLTMWPFSSCRMSAEGICCIATLQQRGLSLYFHEHVSNMSHKQTSVFKTSPQNAGVLREKKPPKKQ